MQAAQAAPILMQIREGQKNENQSLCLVLLLLLNNAAAAAAAAYAMNCDWQNLYA